MQRGDNAETNSELNNYFLMNGEVNKYRIDTKGPT